MFASEYLEFSGTVLAIPKKNYQDIGSVNLMFFVVILFYVLT